MIARGGSGGSAGGRFERPVNDIVNNSFTGLARILVVEDQDDVRRMLVTALEMEGHVVQEAASATEGLKCLEQTRYSLVLTDYAMPGGTGTWMLHEASRKGWLDGTVALVVTAHPDVHQMSGVEVVSKPIDLDRFLDQVRRILGTTYVLAPPPEPTREPAGSRTLLNNAGYRVELVLYVSPASPASLHAQRNLEQLLARFDGTHVKYSICDLGRDPFGGADDRVAFTPTLVKRYPEPRMWVLGSLKDPAIITDLLRSCGVAPQE